MALKSAAKANDPPGNGGIGSRPPKTSAELRGGEHAALEIEFKLGQPRSAKDRENFDSAREAVRSSDLPKELKAMAEGYAEKCLPEAGKRYSLMWGETILNNVASGKIDAKHLAFQIRLMEAWCGGGLKGFIDSERSYFTKGDLPEEDRKEITKLLSLASEAEMKGRSDLAVFTAACLWVYYSQMPPEEKLEMVRSASYILASANL